MFKTCKQGTQFPVMVGAKKEMNQEEGAEIASGIEGRSLRGALWAETSTVGN